jgi:hypothetical protein
MDSSMRSLLRPALLGGPAVRVTSRMFIMVKLIWPIEFNLSNDDALMPFASWIPSSVAFANTRSLRFFPNGALR